jgi:hypothetical protein
MLKTRAGFALGALLASGLILAQTTEVSTEAIRIVCIAVCAGGIRYLPCLVGTFFAEARVYS